MSRCHHVRTPESFGKQISESTYPGQEQTCHMHCESVLLVLKCFVQVRKDICK